MAAFEKVILRTACICCSVAGISSETCLFACCISAAHAMLLTGWRQGVPTAWDALRAECHGWWTVPVPRLLLPGLGSAGCYSLDRPVLELSCLGPALWILVSEVVHIVFLSEHHEWVGLSACIIRLVLSSIASHSDCRAAWVPFIDFICNGIALLLL